MREQHHASCLGYLPSRMPWRPISCKSCDAIDREQAHRRATWEREMDRFIQHGRGENP